MIADCVAVITVLEGGGHSGEQVCEVPTVVELTFSRGRQASKRANEIPVGSDKYSKEEQSNGEGAPDRLARRGLSEAVSLEPALQ